MNQDTSAALAATAAGGAALTLQMLTNYANLGATVLNILLALGGLYLLWKKVKRSWRDDRDHPLR